MYFFTLMKIWFYKYLVRKEVVMAVTSDGRYSVKVLQVTDGGKSFVQHAKNQVGFLDNPVQKEGEFRKGISASNLIRWFKL